MSYGDTGTVSYFFFCKVYFLIVCLIFFFRLVLYSVFFSIFFLLLTFYKSICSTKTEAFSLIQVKHILLKNKKCVCCLKKFFFERFFCVRACVNVFEIKNAIFLYKALCANSNIT